MSTENAQTLDKSNYMHKEYISQSLEDHQNLLETPVLINNNNLEDSPVQEVILNDQILNTLTAITLTDGTQAYITESIIKNENDENSWRLEEGAICLPVTTECNNEKIVQLHLVDSLDNEIQRNSNELSNNPDVYPQLQVIDGVIYLITNEIEECQDFLEISKKEPKNDETFPKSKIEEEKPKIKHECPRKDCTKVYSTLNHLKVHERSHTGLKPYLCTHHKCKKSFSTSYSLKAHLRTHTGEKPYKCTSEDCDKSFKTSGDLLKHVRTHTGERPFVCPYEGCGRSFTTSNIRKVHIRTHTGERPFKCPQPKCGKAFASSTNYKNHVRIHSGEKPYVCLVKSCGRRFTEYSSLYKHQIVHTQERPFKCEACHRQYRQHSTLIMHKKTAHSIISNDNNVDDDEVLDVLLENSVDMIDQKLDGRKNVKVESVGCKIENETDFILVPDPSQLVTFQTIGSINTESTNNILDTALKELNIQYDDIEFHE